MIYHTIKDILSDIETIENRELGLPSLGYSDYYHPVPFLADNFRQLDDMSDGGPLAFIDGGNAELIRSSALSVHFIRTASCTFDRPDGKRRDINRMEYISRARTEMTDDGYSFVAHISGADGTPCSFGPLKMDRENTILGKYPVNINLLGGILRRRAEWDEAFRAAGKMNGGIIVMDGTLQPLYPGESEVIKALTDLCRDRDIALTALAKTSSLMTTTGHSLPAALMLLADENGIDGAWYYTPIVENTNPEHDADIMFVKLHPESRHCFRFEIARGTVESSNLDSVVATVASGSADVSFPGYPYGLIVADELARIPDSEKANLSVLVRSFLDREGALDKLRPLEATADSHDILDSM